jgi:P27 family predicted phage terminase small subunit
MIMDEHRLPPEPPEGLRLMPGTEPRRKAAGAWAGQAAEIGAKINKAANLGPPYDMSDRAAAIWAETVAYLEEMKLFHPADSHVIAAYVEAVVTAELCTELLNGQELLVEGSVGNWVVNKLVGVRRDAWAVMRAIGCGELGLSPAGRTRIEVDPVYIRPSNTGKKPNPFAG